MSTAVAPPAPVIDRHAHLAFFYRGNSEYLRGTIPFVRDGLEAGVPVAVAVPAPRLELVRSELGADAAGVALIDMAHEGRNPGRIIPGVLRAFADSHAGRAVRIIGEPVWAGRSALEYPACAQYEARVNLAFAERTASILCPYDATGLGPLVLADAGRTHPCLGGAGRGWRASRGYDPEGILAHYNQPLPPSQVTATAFDFDRRCLAKARRFAGEQAAHCGLRGDRISDAVQVVGELAANSVVHGGGQGTVRVWPESGHVVCEVRDAGYIGDPLAGSLPAGGRDLNGRGLLMVNVLSDLVRMHTAKTGTVTRAYFALPEA